MESVLIKGGGGVGVKGPNVPEVSFEKLAPMTIARAATNMSEETTNS